MLNQAFLCQKIARLSRQIQHWEALNAIRYSGLIVVLKERKAKLEEEIHNAD